jgi:hypothetical protein
VPDNKATLDAQGPKWPKAVVFTSQCSRTLKISRYKVSTTFTFLSRFLFTLFTVTSLQPLMKFRNFPFCPHVRSAQRRRFFTASVLTSTSFNRGKQFFLAVNYSLPTVQMPAGRRSLTSPLLQTWSLHKYSISLCKRTWARRMCTTASRSSCSVFRWIFKRIEACIMSVGLCWLRRRRPNEEFTACFHDYIHSSAIYARYFFITPEGRKRKVYLEEKNKKYKRLVTYRFRNSGAPFRVFRPITLSEL